MTLADRSHTANYPETQGRQDIQSRRSDSGTMSQQQSRQTNVGGAERLVSVASGSVLALLGLGRRDLTGLLIGAVGGALVYRGATGHCPLYQALDFDTANVPHDAQDISERGIHISQALLINKSPEELYQYWRNFENLPRIMTYLERVDVQQGDGGVGSRSHWVAKAPKLAGGQVEWDAETTADEPNSRIAWRSLPGSQIESVGEVRFQRALGDRGTEVHVSMEYIPPAGRVGHWLASLFGENPSRTIREDLRNFKRTMEVGDILTTIGQPRGTCTGTGKQQDKL